MKKFLSLFVLAVLFASNMSAQFEQGTKFLGASLTGLSLSYSKHEKLGLGAEAKAGIFVMDDLMVQAEAGIDVKFKECQQIFVGAKGRYYVAENIYLGAGAKLLHEFKNHNDFLISPEVGYTYMIKDKFAIEPAFYVDISTNSFSKYTKVGIKVGVGIFSN
jgi:hypothetical protein